MHRQRPEPASEADVSKGDRTCSVVKRLTGPAVLGGFGSAIPKSVRGSWELGVLRAYTCRHMLRTAARKVRIKETEHWRWVTLCSSKLWLGGLVDILYVYGTALITRIRRVGVVVLTKFLNVFRYLEENSSVGSCTSFFFFC